jgi:hypothetical protein
MSDQLADEQLRRELERVARQSRNGTSEVGRKEGPTPASWGRIDLLQAADEDPDPPPSILRRTDGFGLIYPGRRHSLSAEPESAKTWLMHNAAAEQLADGHAVVFFDFEGDPKTIGSRALALGVESDALRRLAYFRPEEPIGDAWESIEAVLDELAPTLALIDGTTEAMALHGLDLKDNKDVAGWGQLLPIRLKQRGIATLESDHLPKDKESRGRFAIGAQHKLAVVDVGFGLSVVKPFGRGLEGLAALKVQKDRQGYLRERENTSRQVAIVRLRSEADGAVAIDVEPPEDDGGKFRPTGFMERLSRAIEQEPGINKRDLRKAVSGNSEAKDKALRILIEEGFVDPGSNGNSHSYRSLRPYREGTERDPTTVTTVTTRDQGVPDGVPGGCDHVTPPLIGGARGTPDPHEADRGDHEQLEALGIELLEDT